MTLKPFCPRFNDENYYSYTTKGIREKIDELQEHNQLNQENVKKLIDDTIEFSSENHISLEKLTKRLIKCRTTLKAASPGEQELFDRAIEEKQRERQGEEQSSSFATKFKQKNYTREDTKQELTNFVSRISGIIPREQHL